MLRMLMIFFCITAGSATAEASAANSPSGSPTSLASVSPRPERRPAASPQEANGAIEYVEGVDKKFDASLAATLAGLALAAAAFLGTLEQQKRNDLTAKTQSQDPLELAREAKRFAKAGKIDPVVDQLYESNKATKLMIWAFFFFVGVLVNAILVHPAEALKGELSKQLIADFTVSSCGMTAGLGAMIWGAICLRRACSPGKLEQETLDPNSDR